MLSELWSIVVANVCGQHPHVKAHADCSYSNESSSSSSSSSEDLPKVHPTGLNKHCVEAATEAFQMLSNHRQRGCIEGYYHILHPLGVLSFCASLRKCYGGPSNIIAALGKGWASLGRSFFSAGQAAWIGLLRRRGSTSIHWTWIPNAARRGPQMF